MQGTAYGARSGTAGMFGELPRLDVKVTSQAARLIEPGADEVRFLVVTEEPYASEVAEVIAAAQSWDELPVVDFEEYQVIGEGTMRPSDTLYLADRLDTDDYRELGLRVGIALWLENVVYPAGGRENIREEQGR